MFINDVLVNILGNCWISETKLAAMLVHHQGAPIWRHHTIYYTHGAYSVAYISVENYLIWLQFGQVTKFLVLFQKNIILM